MPPVVAETALRFPAKAIVTPERTLLVADSARHSLAELAADGETLLRRIGSGIRGRADGAAAEASFSEPAGLSLLPPEVAERVGYDVVVADTVNHLLRGVRLSDGFVTTVAGTGEQWRDGGTDGPATEIELTSPWDVEWWAPAGGVVVALAGNHTIGLFDPVAGTVSRFAGTTVEGLRDGEAAQAFFAQTSGLAADPVRERLWLADSETSALRYLAYEDGVLAVRTVIGTGLFDFGHRDGPAAQALLQHPLGVAVLPDGSIGVADTYNGALRRYHPESGEVSTIATDLAEPSGVVVLDDAVVVVSSAAHRLERPVPPGVAAKLVSGAAQQVRRPPSELAAGAVELAVVFVPPPGQKLDERYGPSTRLEVTASPPELLVEGAGVGTDLVRRLVIAADVPSGVLHVVAQAASCDEGVEHPACRLTRQDWGVPVVVQPGAPIRLPLVMGGMDEPGV